MTAKPNIREIAKHLNCSPSTVSRVLSGRDSNIKISDKTRKLILEYCNTIGYQPSIHAARFFSGESRMIGFLATEKMLDDDNLSLSLFATCRELFKANYRCLPLLNNRKFIETKEYLNIFKRNEIDALIIWGANETHTYLNELQKAGYPFILLTNRVADFPAISVNQQDPIIQLVNHCKELGAKRIAGIFDHSGDSHIQRRNGFLKAVSDVEHKIFITNLNRDDVYQHGAEVYDWRPDAVICGNDYAAIGIERYFSEKNVNIPNDVMITGGDNIPGSMDCIVPLTTFDQMAETCAIHCVAQVLDHLRNGTSFYSEELKTKPIFRQSTAKKHSHSSE